MALPSTSVKFRLFLADGQPAVGAKVTARLTRPDTDAGGVVPGKVVGGTADSAGECVLALWPNARGVSGSQYSVAVMRGGMTEDRYLITVPESETMVLSETIKSAPPYPSVSAAQQALEAAQAATVVAQGHATTATTQAGIATGAASDAAADAIATAADRVQTGLDRASATASAAAASTDAGTASAAAASATGAASTATTKAGEASTSAAAALASETTAAASASTASGAASTATTKASEASASASSASGSAGTATTAASTATTAAGTATTQAGIATAKAAEAAASAASAQAAAEASGPVLFFNTKALANTALAGLPDLQVVEVFVDESQGGYRTRYRKESGVYAFKLNLSVPRTFYVSNSGSDSNNGLTMGEPFATIGRLMQETIGPGTTVALRRGSAWREQLTVGDGVTVKAYGGSGALPLLDASDALPNAGFSLYSGNTYVTTVTRDGYSPRVYENGALLSRKTSKALVDSTPGSFVVEVSGVVKNREVSMVSATAWTIYVHPTGSTNPVSDGKLYEYPARQHGLLTGSECTVEYVHTRRQWHPDGSMIVGQGGYIKGCLATDGAKHNLWLTSGLAEDCVTDRNEPDEAQTTGGSTHFVSFSGSVYGLDVTYRRCTAMNGIALGFYGHTDGGGKYRRAVFEDCINIEVGGGFNVNEVEQLINERCKIYATVLGADMSGGGADSFAAIDCEAYVSNAGSSLFVTPATGKTADVRGGRFCLSGGEFVRVNAPGTLSVTGAKIFFDNLDGQSGVARVFSNSSNPAATLSLTHCVIDGALASLTGSAATLTMDYNIINADATFTPLQPASNKHSLLCDRAFLGADPRNGDWSVRPDIPKPGITLNAVAHTNGVVGGDRYFMAVGLDGYITLCPASINSTFPGKWNRYNVATPTPNDLFGVVCIARAPWAFVVVGAAGSIFSTANYAVSWTQRTTPAGLSATTFRAIADDGVNTVAVGDGGAIIRSTDAGATWAQVGSGVTAANLLGIAANGSGTWVAVGVGGVRLKSTDNGATWAAATMGSKDLYCIRFADSKWVAGGAFGTIYTSTDATTWTQRYPAAYHHIKSIGYGLDSLGSGSKTWIAVCARVNMAGGSIMRSADPTVAGGWTEVNSPIDADWSAVAFKAYEDGVFVIVGAGDLSLMTSKGQGFRVVRVGGTRIDRYGTTPASWRQNMATRIAKL